MARLYYRGALGALIVFDITREYSFHNLVMWIEEVKRAAGEEVVLMIIGKGYYLLIWGGTGCQ